MLTSFFSRRTSAVPKPDQREEVAYLQLEQARLSIELLLNAHGNRRRSLVETHRHLGLAGYECSLYLHRDVRLTWLKRAHKHVDDVGDLAATVRTIIRAGEAVEDALVERFADHLQSAHNHTVAACECFDRYLEFELQDQPLR